MPEPEKTVVQNEPGKTATQNSEQIQEQPPREVTQTDHINKKLLTSLFKRMDEAGNSSLAKMLEPDNKLEDDDEWND